MKTKVNSYDELEVYLETNQTSVMEFFSKAVNYFRKKASS